jgi:hypothetical protein
VIIPGVPVLTVNEPPPIDGLSAPQAYFLQVLESILSSPVIPQTGLLPALSIGHVFLQVHPSYPGREVSKLLPIVKIIKIKNSCENLFF